MSGSSRMRELVLGYEDDSEYGPIVRLLLAIRGSFLLSTIALGCVMILAGIAVEVALTNQGVVAAMLLIWGVSGIIYGLLGFAFVLAIEYQ